MIERLITPIARSIDIEPNPDDRVSRSERLALAALEQMKLCTIEGGRLFQILTELLF